MKTTFLFPGQGSQAAGMLKSYPLNDPIVDAVFSEVKETLGMQAITLDTEKKLTSTVYVQLCLCIAGVISARRLLAANIHPDYVAGHSVGAFAAAVASGVITFKEALLLVYSRATLMEKAYPSGYGMAAVVGLSQARLDHYILQHNLLHDTVYLANSNAAHQQVIAGPLHSIDVFLPVLQKAGARKAQLLKVSVPSHCELLDGVSNNLKQQLDNIELREPVIPYISNHTGRLLRTGTAIREDLYKSVAATVKWYEGTTLLYELGTRIFIEMAPPGVLAKIAEATFPEANVLALEDGNMETLQWLYNSYTTDK